jgi:hypothetical protein
MQRHRIPHALLPMACLLLPMGCVLQLRWGAMAPASSREWFVQQRRLQS